MGAVASASRVLAVRRKSWAWEPNRVVRSRQGAGCLGLCNCSQRLRLRRCLFRAGEPFRPNSLRPSYHSSADALPLCPTVFAKNFRVAAAMKTSVLLSWEVPDSYKSAVPFKVGEGRGPAGLRAGRPGRNSRPAVGIRTRSGRRVLPGEACAHELHPAGL